MENKEENLPLMTFKLLNVFTNVFNFKGITKKFELKPGAINYNIDPKIAFNIDESKVFVFLHVSANVVSTEEDFFECKINFHFEVEDLKKIVGLAEDKGVKFKFEKQAEPFNLTLISIAYSTARGIIMEKGAGTILQQQFLPIVNPSVFLKKGDEKSPR